MASSQVYTDTKKALDDAAATIPTDGTELSTAVKEKFQPLITRATAAGLDPDVVSHLQGQLDKLAAGQLKESFDRSLGVVKNAVEAAATTVETAHTRARGAATATP